MKKVMVVFGTRPEAIKMCPLVKELQKHADIQTVVAVTGQHREMLRQVLDVFHVVPDYDLDIMTKGQDLFDITIRILSEFRDVLRQEKPDVVLVHGDTTTSFVAGLASFYEQIDVGHVEAGLRTYNLKSPFPEEFNRQGVGLVAKYHFSPTEAARQNLINEGKNADGIIVTGNTAIDALQMTVREDFSHPLLDWIGNQPFLLITAHRRENLGEPMHQMFRAIRRVLEKNPTMKAIYPIHLNPQVRHIANQYLTDLQQIRLIEPLDVIDFHNLMARAHIILTDSGGIQEEAPSLHVPVLVMRDTTERPEGIEAGTLRLTGTSEESIFEHFMELIENPDVYAQMSQAANPYGDGHASERIVQFLVEHMNQEAMEGVAL